MGKYRLSIFKKGVKWNLETIHDTALEAKKAAYGTEHSTVGDKMKTTILKVGKKYVVYSTYDYG